MCQDLCSANYKPSPKTSNRSQRAIDAITLPALRYGILICYVGLGLSQIRQSSFITKNHIYHHFCGAMDN
jgi:hypothetical protein